MAVMKGVVVTKSKEWFSWKVGGDEWSFRQWPEETLVVDKVSLREQVVMNEIKLVEEAVMFSLGYTAGHRRGKYSTLDEILES